MRRLSIKKIGLIILACALLLPLKSCDFRLMTNQEVEQTLARNYGKEFVVISSKRISVDDPNVYRAKVYVASPKDEPERQFFVFNTVEGERFGVPGFFNGFSDTYNIDIFREALEARAADTDVEYTFQYIYPIKSSSVYYEYLYVNIDSVSPENLETVCTVLSQAYADTFEEIQGVPSFLAIILTYREPAWPEEESCLVRIDNYNYYWDEETQSGEMRELDTEAEAIQEYILSEVNWFKTGARIGTS